MTHLLVFLGRDFLKEIRDGLPLWDVKAQTLEVWDHILPGTMEHQVACTQTGLLLQAAYAFPFLSFPLLPFPFTGALCTVQFRPQQMQASNSLAFGEQQDISKRWALGSFAAAL